MAFGTGRLTSPGGAAAAAVRRLTQPGAARQPGVVVGRRVGFRKVSAAAEPSLFAKIGRTLKEKAQARGRGAKGGVRLHPTRHLTLQPPRQPSFCRPPPRPPSAMPEPSDFRYVQGDLDRLFGGAEKTRERLGVVDELLAYWRLEDAEDTFEELEDALIGADFGPRTAIKLVDALRDDARAGKVKNAADIKVGLRRNLRELLEGAGDASLNLAPGPDGQPCVVLVVGVNGGGKTTSVGKLATRLAREGLDVILVPGDTFRAAAEAQLSRWCDRAASASTDGAGGVGDSAGSVTMAAFEEGKKPSAVLYDAVKAAQTAKADVVLCDTSGRLHTNEGLMKELAGCRNAVARAQPGAPAEVLLVLDGTTGLNMVNQAREFSEACAVTGLVVTKLDGTSRGGAIAGVVDQLSIPVKLVGVGEGVDDLQVFDAEGFIASIFGAGEEEG